MNRLKNDARLIFFITLLWVVPNKIMAVDSFWTACKLTATGMGLVNSAIEEAASLYGENEPQLLAQLGALVQEEGIATIDIASIDWVGSTELLPPVHKFIIKLRNGSEVVLDVSLVDKETTP